MAKVSLRSLIINKITMKLLEFYLRNVLLQIILLINIIRTYYSSNLIHTRMFKVNKAILNEEEGTGTMC